MLPNDDLRIAEIKELLPPIALLERFPATKKAQQTVAKARQVIHQMLVDKDRRLLVIIGPCSIHDTNAALEYANRLLSLRKKYKNQLEIVMRVYFEKPRTTIGWKGLLNDPYLNGTFDMNQGLRIGRKLLLDLTSMGMPTAVEFLDMISPQYLADLVCWGAIGARTTESQIHRQLGSGMSCPIGFKNGTNGNTQIAIDAIGSAKATHHFLSVTKFGHSAIVATKGNEDSHIILRGGKQPNYYAEDVAEVEAMLEKNQLAKKIMIDCSHANSNKQFKQQLVVADDVARQLANGNRSIFGVMVESHLVEGNQQLGNVDDLAYGQSITDACIGWQDTETVLKTLADAVRQRQNKYGE
ncbi:MAG: 3-deoxy-7-phosphoheptulonate synthase [Gammaproteobacteria bacterium]|nr:MAG: 3-deoxy-7-phosphoheptulonate synthase [Gammaproteobacteria bacterium]